MTSFQKENEIEQEMEVLDVFLELVQVILMQTAMKTPVLQIVDLAWKPLKTEMPHLDSSVRNTTWNKEVKITESQMNICIYNLVKQPLKKN